MNWKVKWSQDEKFVTVETAGKFSVEGHKQMIEDLLSHDFWKPGLYVFFDHRKLDFGYTNIDLLRRAGEVHQKHDNRLGNGKVAFLVKSLSDYGRGRQFELITEDKISAKLRIFMDQDEALQWLLDSMKHSD